MQTATGSFTFQLEIVKWSSDNPKPALRSNKMMRSAKKIINVKVAEINEAWRHRMTIGSECMVEA